MLSWQMLTLQAKQAHQRLGADQLKEMTLASRHFVQLWKQLVVRNGILYCLFEDPGGERGETTGGSPRTTTG